MPLPAQSNSSSSSGYTRARVGFTGGRPSPSRRRVGGLAEAAPGPSTGQGLPTGRALAIPPFDGGRLIRESRLDRCRNGCSLREHNSLYSLHLSTDSLSLSELSQIETHLSPNAPADQPGRSAFRWSQRRR